MNDINGGPELPLPTAEQMIESGNLSPDVERQLAGQGAMATAQGVQAATAAQTQVPDVMSPEPQAAERRPAASNLSELPSFKAAPDTLR